MAIQIKRQGGGQTSSASAAAPSSLNYGELACASNGDLYVGNGSRTPVGVVTTNGNKTISGTMRFAGNSTFSGTARFAGATSFANVVRFYSGVTFSGAPTFPSAVNFQDVGISGGINFTNIDSGQKGLYGIVGGDDAWRIQGGASAANAGYLEIATADDANEPIYVRQYKYSSDGGSFAIAQRTLTLLDSNGETRVPGRIISEVSAGDTGANPNGAMIVSSRQNHAGIYIGSADTDAQTLGTSPGTNMYIKSWWGLGIVDGCSGNGITVGIDCRNGHLKCKGNVRASRVYNAVYNDYAEYFPRGEETEPGDLVALDLDSQEEKYIKARNGFPVVGVHSNEYGHIIGGEEKPPELEHITSDEYNIKKYIPVGLCGRCKIKIIGKILKGQKIIVSDIPGVGRAYNRKTDSMGDYIDSIGIAVEDQPIDDNEIRLVKVKLK